MSKGQWIKNRDKRLVELTSEVTSLPFEICEQVLQGFAVAAQLRMLETGGTTTIPWIGDLTLNLKEFWSGLTKQREPSVRATVNLTERFKEDFRRLRDQNPSVTAEELTQNFRQKLAIMIASDR